MSNQHQDLLNNLIFTDKDAAERYQQEYLQQKQQNLSNQNQNQYEQHQEQNLQSNQKQNEPNYLHDQYNQSKLENEILQLNQHLNSLHKYPIGNLLDNSTQSVEQTMKSVYKLLQDLQCLQDLRKDHLQQQKKFQDEYQLSQNNVKILQKRVEKLEKERNLALNKVNAVQQQFEQEISHLKYENKELTTNLNKILSREAQYQNEINKKDKQNSDLKAKFLKLQQDKNTSYTNSSQFITSINLNKADAFQDKNSSGIQEYANLFNKKQEGLNELLKNENIILREGLQAIHNDLNEMFYLRKDIFLKRKKIEGMQEEHDENKMQQIQALEDIYLLPFQRELFQMPGQDISQDAVSMLQDNIRQFKQFMNTIDNINEYDLEEKQFQNQLKNQENDQNLEKLSSVKNLKEILQKYKYMVECQDQLLSNTIQKANDYQIPTFMSAQNNQNKDRFSKIMDDKEMEQAKSFLLEQKKFLEDKSKDLDTYKQKMSDNIKQLDSKKKEILHKRTQAEQEANQFKENMVNLVNQYTLNPQQLQQDNSSISQAIPQLQQQSEDVSFNKFNHNNQTDPNFNFNNNNNNNNNNQNNNSSSNLQYYINNTNIPNNENQASMSQINNKTYLINSNYEGDGQFDPEQQQQQYNCNQNIEINQEQNQSNIDYNQQKILKNLELDQDVKKLQSFGKMNEEV